MKKAVKYIFYSLAIAYFPLIFVISCFSDDSGSILHIPYFLIVLVLFIYTLPIYLACLELGFSLGRAFDNRVRSVGEKVINTASLALAGAILVTLIDIESLLYVSSGLAGGIVILWIVGAIIFRRERKLPEIFKKRSFWLSAATISLVLCLGVVGIGTLVERGKGVQDPYGEGSHAFEVKEVYDSYLLVTPSASNPASGSSDLFSVPNNFENSVKKGDTVVISHNGLIQETYPASFNKIYEMTLIGDDGTVETVIID